MAHLESTNQAWAQDRSRFGAKMLLKHGWTPGGGLGKNEDGASSAVKVTRRAPQLALGAEADGVGTGNTHLLSAVQDFNALLASMQPVVAARGSAESSSSGSEEEEEEAERGGGRADAAATTTSADFVDRSGLTVAVSSAVGRAATRTRMLRCKNVAAYNPGDLSSILGGARVAAVAAAIPSPPRGARVVSARDAAKAAKAERKAARAAKRARKAERRGEPSS